jgi:hypothetical protein
LLAGKTPVSITVLCTDEPVSTTFLIAPVRLHWPFLPTDASSKRNSNSVALAPANEPPCLRPSRTSGGTGVGHVIADPTEGTITQCATLNIGPGFRGLYLGYYAEKEVRLPPAVRFAVGEVLTESMLLEKRTLERSEVYNDLLRPFDVPHFMFAWLQKTERQAQTIAIEGSLAHGPFDKDAIDRFSLVIPHLVRATRLRDHFIAVRASRLHTVRRSRRCRSA